jgi:hypothetical protein
MVLGSDQNDLGALTALLGTDDSKRFGISVRQSRINIKISLP